MTFTVLGASGFVGRHLVAHLRREGVACRGVARGEHLAGAALGHVICCVGLTADFRERPLDAVEAHVAYLLPLLREARFESFLYLSSTRVYDGAPAGDEDASLRVNPADPSDLYNLSKLTGEAVCLAASPRARVARLSNVYGPDFGSANFLTSVLRDAVDRGRVVLRSAPESEKDYVSVADVVRLLPRIALEGRQRLYNVASGTNVSNAALLQALRELTGCSVETAPGAPALRFPAIRVKRVMQEFPYAPSRVLDALPDLIAAYTNTDRTIDQH